MRTLKEHPILTGTRSVGIMTPEEPKYPAAAGGHTAFRAALRDMGLQHEATMGHYEKPENSYIIYGPTREQMSKLGKDFGQEAVVYSEGGHPEMMYTNGPNVGQSHPHDPSGDTMWDKHPDEPYWTVFPGHGYGRLGFDWNRLEPHKPRTRPIFGA